MASEPNVAFAVDANGFGFGDMDVGRMAVQSARTIVVDRSDVAHRSKGLLRGIAKARGGGRGHERMRGRCQRLSFIGRRTMLPYDLAVKTNLSDMWRLGIAIEQRAAHGAECRRTQELTKAPAHKS